MVIGLSAYRPMSSTVTGVLSESCLAIMASTGITSAAHTAVDAGPAEDHLVDRVQQEHERDADQHR